MTDFFLLLFFLFFLKIYPYSLYNKLFFHQNVELNYNPILLGLTYKIRLFTYYMYTILKYTLINYKLHRFHTFLHFLSKDFYIFR